MRALMQDYPLTLDKILSHAANWSSEREVVTRLNDGRITRTTYAAIHDRAKRVSAALLDSGIRPGDRVATMAWNGSRHFEVCYGIMGIGAVHHTLNPRLFPEQIVYIINHAQDRIILADAVLAPLLDELLPQCPSVERVIYLTDAAGMPGGAHAAQDYESWIAGYPADCAWGGFPEDTAAGLCYTSGTTGNPKGVLYGHRSNYLHALMTLQPDALNLSRNDTVLLVVPMYHANAWGVVYSAPLVGAKLVLPGQRMDGAAIHELIESEGVTYSAAVPTVWQMLLDHVKAVGGGFSALRQVTVGGSACPESLIRTFHDDYGVEVVQGWGMTETSPLGTVSRPSRDLAARPIAEQLPDRLKQGHLLCNLDLKIVDDSGQTLPRDGETPGRLMIKGPTIASGYFGMDGDSLDPEGFFDTGDVATLTRDGLMHIRDRAKDVIKSGGEWISSIEVENVAVGHPAAQLCAVIGVAHPKWDERPALFVQLKAGENASAQDFLDYLDGRIARWWMPDHVVFIDEIPLGPTGKIDKRALAARLDEFDLPPAAVTRS